MPELQTASTAKSLFARYRAWERRVYSASVGPEETPAMDAYAEYFYSRKGWWIHAVELAALIGLSWIFMRTTNMAWWAAVLLSALLVVVCASLVMMAWFTPRTYAKSFRFKSTSFFPMLLAGLLCGLALGVLVRTLETDARLPSVGDYFDALQRAAQSPLVWIIVGGFVLTATVLAGIARMRRLQLEQENALLAAASERDQSARTAAEAQLKVLQVQIKPHFLFNTLAAMQHWVDSKDERAGPLLRNLTQFLRQSVQALDKPSITIAEEFELVSSYLSIMSARLGGRLTYMLDQAADVATQPIPPGMVLTLTENALEHGVTPALRGGHVSVAAGRTGEHWWVEVTDNGVGFSGAPHFSVGLRNTQERLAGLYGAAARFTLTRNNALAKTVARIECKDSTS